MFMSRIQFPQGVNDSSSSERYNRLWTWLWLSTESATPSGSGASSGSDTAGSGSDYVLVLVGIDQENLCYLGMIPEYPLSDI